MTPREGRTARLRHNTHPPQAHIGPGEAQARIEAAPERRHHGNGQEPSHECVMERRTSLRKAPAIVYHSIVSALPGWGFCSTAATLAFAHMDARSAMSAKAELWVMSTTVLPVVRARVLQKLQDSLAGFVIQGTGGFVGTTATWVLGSARAMATRCCSPPESCGGKLLMRWRGQPGRRPAPHRRNTAVAMQCNRW